MQRSHYRFVSALSLFVFLAVWFNCACGQVQPRQLYQAYKEKDFKRLQTLLKQADAAHSQSPVIRFYRAVFTVNADSAVQIYKDVFKRADASTRLLAAKKLYEYYYAKGFYVTAAKYQKYMAEHTQEGETEQTPAAPDNARPASGKMFYIQVGAFGIKENAQQRRMFLKTQDIQSVLVERNLDGRTLYCVWIKGYADIEKTLEMANRLKSKFDLEYQIMKK